MIKSKKISITKYNPKFRNDLGHYLKDDWTSISDVGMVYENKVFTYEEYYKVEQLYVNAVLACLRYFNSQGVRILHIYKFTDYNNIYKGDNGQSLYEVYRSLSNGQFIENPTIIEQVIKLRLREYIGELELQIHSKSRSKILFGFDYYMYLQTNKNIEQLAIEIENLGLFVY